MRECQRFVTLLTKLVDGWAKCQIGKKKYLVLKAQFSIKMDQRVS